MVSKIQQILHGSRISTSAMDRDLESRSCMVVAGSQLVIACRGHAWDISRLTIAFAVGDRLEALLDAQIDNLHWIFSQEAACWVMEASW